jgi:hypothetical protein
MLGVPPPWCVVYMVLTLQRFSILYQSRHDHLHWLILVVGGTPLLSTC